MPHRIRPVPFKPSRLDGLSERLLASHYENNYGGAVRRLNAIERDLSALDPAGAPIYVLNGLKREQLIAANSMVLHEVYFDGLGGTGEPAGDLAQALERDFGSVTAWRAEFVAMAKAQAGGSGWTILTWSGRLGRLTNQWAADHTHTLAGGTPILAIDMYEHAYHLDFGARAAAYVDAMMRNIHWERVAERHRQAVARDPAVTPAAASPTIAAEDLKAEIDDGRPIRLIDLRLADDLAKGTDRLPGARWLDPQKLDAWAAELPKGEPIVAYCVYGFQVSGDAVAALRQRGLDVRNLAGGIAAWHAIGAPTEPKS
jgi:Fe-Mn family superoxide dismutase